MSVDDHIDRWLPWVLSAIVTAISAASILYLLIHGGPWWQYAVMLLFASPAGLVAYVELKGEPLDP